MGDLGALWRSRRNNLVFLLFGNNRLFFLLPKQKALPANTVIDSRAFMKFSLLSNCRDYAGQ